MLTENARLELRGVEWELHIPVIFDKHDTLVLFNLTLQLTVLRKFHILHIVSYGTYVEF